MPRTRPSDAAGRQKEAQAMTLRIAGVTYERIAGQLGYQSASVARGAVVRAMSRIPEEKAVELRQMMMQQLDLVIEHMARIMVRPQVRTYRGQPIYVEQAQPDGTVRRVPVVDQEAQIAAAMAVVRVQESQRKLQGLDAATKYEHAGPGGGPIPVEEREQVAEGLLAKIRLLRQPDLPALGPGEIATDSEQTG